jgi:hypothetical protein
VTEQFGVDAYPKALRKLLALRQTDSLKTYVDEFERAKYGVVVHNPRMGEPFLLLSLCADSSLRYKMWFKFKYLPP